MKHTLLYLLIIFFTPLCIFSQDTKVEQIKNEFEELINSLEEGNPLISVFTIENQEIHRAIGPVEKNIALIYEISETENKDDDIGYLFEKIRYLRIYHETVKAGANITERGWYYTKTGNLISYGERDVISGCTEIIYLENNEIIQIIGMRILTIPDFEFPKFSEELQDFVVEPEELLVDKIDYSHCTYTRNPGEFTPEDFKKISEIQSQKDRHFNLLKALSEE